MEPRHLWRSRHRGECHQRTSTAGERQRYTDIRSFSGPVRRCSLQSGLANQHYDALPLRWERSERSVQRDRVRLGSSIQNSGAVRGLEDVPQPDQPRLVSQMESTYSSSRRFLDVTSLKDTLLARSPLFDLSFLDFHFGFTRLERRYYR